MERALAVPAPVLTEARYAVHFAGNLLEVMLNVRQWNRDLGTESSARQWRQRTVTYFVFDAGSGAFAPSKFCAYLAIPKRPLSTETTPVRPFALGMTVDAHEQIEHDEARFDRGKAWRHLVERLGMSLKPLAALPALQTTFYQWLASVRDAITVYPDGTLILLPPTRFQRTQR
jgi:hypothetical protein